MTLADDPGNPEPIFDVAVPDTGYRWWYVDGISDDVVIAFIGSVFSPYYYRARSRGRGIALDYCAINVGLYRRRGKVWAMTERDRYSVSQSVTEFHVGPSKLQWDEGKLVIDVRERSMPFARRVEGRIVVEPRFLNTEGFALDPGELHHWRPISPMGRIDVQMTSPGVRWSGAAYLDTNWGRRPLEDDFTGWNWSRHSDESQAAITYAADLLDGSSSSLALDFDTEGRISRREIPPEIRLRGTGWRVDRRTRSETALHVQRTLEDTPFYSRSILSGPSGSQGSLVMHESLSLRRFRSAWVRQLLPFRMPRIRTATTEKNSRSG